MERPHKRLTAWQKAMDLAVLTYTVTQKFPSDERFGLIRQMRRAASSVPANIAEGSARASDREELQFLMVARGSLSELDTFRDLALRLGFGDETDLNRMGEAINEVSAVIQGLVERKQNSVGCVHDSNEESVDCPSIS